MSNLRFAAINHAKQRSFQCALMCPCAQNNRSKATLGITFHRFSVDKYAKESWIVRIRGDVGKNFQLVTVVCDFKLASFVCNQFVQVYKVI